jgi:hypothetical protein
MIEIWGPTDRMRREIELWAPWMSEDEAQELLDEIDQMPMSQRKPMARTLGERLQVFYGERARLRLQTIGPCDMTEAAMALLRKQKKRQRDKLRRRRKPRSEYLAVSLTQTKPWLALGISRRTYYYRIKQEQANCTSVRQVNLTKTECIPVQEEKHGSNASECVRVSTATPAGLVQTCAESLTAEDDLGWWMQYAHRAWKRQLEMHLANGTRTERGPRQRSITRVRLSFIAALPREGRIRRQIRRAFIARKTVALNERAARVVLSGPTSPALALLVDHTSVAPAWCDIAWTIWKSWRVGYLLTQRQLAQRVISMSYRLSAQIGKHRGNRRVHFEGHSGAGKA